VSARERAAFAWDVLPVVYADAIASIGGSAVPAEAVVASDGRLPSDRPRRREGGDDFIHVDSRPGLGALSARAGEALGSYVAPTTAAVICVLGQERDEHAGDGEPAFAERVAPVPALSGADEPEAAEQLDLHSGGLREQTVCLEALGKSARRAHRTDRVRARRPDADLEDVEDGDVHECAV
jgi:hypothetical protein